MEKLIISADSHVIEVPDLWEKGMPQSLRRPRAEGLLRRKERRLDVRLTGGACLKPSAACLWPAQQPDNLENFRKAGFSVARPGGWDPIVRMKDMDTDGVSAEVLYPSLGLGLYCIEDADPPGSAVSHLQRLDDRLLPERCRIVSMASRLISMYDIDHAIAEMERCKKAGMVGTMIWQVPDPKLPFTSEHYERFWAASQDLDMPIHLHILTGFGASMNRQTGQGINRYRIGVNQTREIEDALFDMIFSGVLERYPKLKIVSVENEVGWMPFWLGQCDKGFKRHRHAEKLPSINCPANISSGKFTRRSSMTMSAGSCSPGGAATTACGPTTIRTRTRPGRTRAMSSIATWATCQQATAPSC